MNNNFQIIKSLQDLFLLNVQDLPCQEITKSYIISVFSFPEKLKNLSDRSITLCYTEAYSRSDFILFQNLSDWLLFVETYFPENLTHADSEYYTTIARMSYYHCFKMTRRKLLMYEELADQFDEIVRCMRYNDRS